MPPRTAGRAPVLAAGERGSARRNRRGRIAVAGEEESGRRRGLSRPPPRDRGGRSLAATAPPRRRRAPARREGGKSRSNRGWRLWAQPIGGMDFRRGHARASNGKLGLLPVVSLTFASRTTVWLVRINGRQEPEFSCASAPWSSRYQARLPQSRSCRATP